MITQSTAFAALGICQGPYVRVFPRPFTHGGISAGGQSVNGGDLMKGGQRPYGGDLTLIDYIIN